MFGKEKTLRREAWADIAAELKGEHRLGKWGRPDQVIVHVGVWEVVLDTFARSDGNSSHPFTRMRAVYRPTAEFDFKLVEDKTPDFIKNIFNMQDVRVGDDVFDRRFRIKANSAVKVQALFSEKDIRRMLTRMRHAKLETKKGGGLFNKMPEQYKILYFESRKYLRQPETLKTMFALFAVTLKQMHRLGLTANEMPSYKIS